ncbi:acyltransferase family protein [Vibrio breoganii]|uniref:acyltransferase n=1 Tax=Vibrio breoganii TaxID=553239 RepID=UPI000C847736|nr:acyltransferase family protein [Vibrio breoganii]PMO34730.1 fucose 4-O-acetylase [Vibrio breoganii]
MSTTNQRIPSLELGRIIAILAVITIHSQLFVAYPLYKETPWLGDFINQASRFAVPYFFLLTGYLLQPKLSRDPIGTALSYIKPLTIIWLVWSVIYLLMPFNLMTAMTEGYVAERSMYWDYLALTPFNSLLEGGLVHLWYLPALVIGVGLVSILIKANLHRLLVPLSIILFIYGVLAGSYFNATDIPSLFYTRNGPFFSLIMIVLGFEIRRLNISVSSVKALTILIIGMLIHFVEACYLLSWDVDFRIHDYLFGTPIWALGFFFFLLANPSLGESKWVQPVANLTLGIYVSHLLLVIYLSNLAGFLGFELWKKDLLVWFGTIVISTLFTYLMMKTPLRRVLFR